MTDVTGARGVRPEGGGGMIVSVHLPKTAGTSFGKSLEDHFGARLYRDYRDLPLNTPPLRRKLSAALASVRHAGSSLGDIECIHGHFLPLKYRLLRIRRPVHFVTWLRDPPQRLLSHYHFWRRSYDPRTSAVLHRRVVEEDWSFERFCRSSQMRNVYTQFLWGLSLSDFAFVGITEHYEEDLRAFAERFLGTSLTTHKAQVNDRRDDARYAIDPGLRAEIEAFHADDVLLYRHALARRRASPPPPRADRHAPPPSGRGLGARDA